MRNTQHAIPHEYINVTKWGQSYAMTKHFSVWSNTTLGKDILAELKAEEQQEVVIKDHNRPNGKRATFVHPRVFELYSQWAQRPVRQNKTAGLLYVVSSSDFIPVKIGKWSGTIENLCSRYGTLLARHMRIDYVRVSIDMDKEEEQMLSHFEEHCIGGELFRKQHQELYVEYLGTLGDVQYIEKGSA